MKEGEKERGEEGEEEEEEEEKEAADQGVYSTLVMTVDAPLVITKMRGGWVWEGN